MVVKKEEVMEQLSRVLAIIPQKYIDALLTLHAKLDGKQVEWSVGGDLGEELRTVKVNPDCVEILTSKEGAEQIAEAAKEFNPSKIAFQTRQLARNARLQEKEYPVYARSYYFEFKIDTTEVRVHGDLQYRVDEWEWGDILQFTPEYVNVVGQKFSVVPLSLKYEFYQQLGWGDRADKVQQVLERQRARKPPMLG